MWQRVLSIGGVSVLLAAGILGSIFPIIPGFPFLIGAFLLMPVAIPRTRKWINSMDRRMTFEHRLKVRRAIRKIPIKAIREAVQR